MSDEYEHQQPGNLGSLDLAARKRVRNDPMPTREELLARNSFGSPDDNPYLKRQQTEPDSELARMMAIQKKWGIRK